MPLSRNPSKKPRLKIVVISSFDNTSNKLLSTLILTLVPNIDVVNIIIINTNAYYTACKLKKCSGFYCFYKKSRVPSCKRT